MDLDRLMAHVGADRFRRACRAAWATAATTGRRRGAEVWPDDLADVPHELSDLVDGDLRLGFALYRAMPCYANLMYLGFSEHDDAFWDRIRALLDVPDDRLANPVLYWLWCGPFESPSEVTDAWTRLTAGADDRRLARLLDVSGPVPWRLKAPLIERYAGRRPDLALRALEAASYDIHGDVDPAAARRLLDRLPPGPGTTDLRDRLDELGRSRSRWLGGSARWRSR
ncbi:MAG TPA: hypothetical protein VGJ44_24255 [Kribbellaceae bacterium]